MTESKIARAIGQLEDDLIRAAITYSPTHSKVKKIKWVLLAACICLLLFSATAVAVSNLGTQVTDFFTDKREPRSDYSESGFDMTIQMEKIPADALTGDIQEVGELIRQQYQNYQYWNNWLPSHVQKKFNTQQDALAYIGFSGLKQFGWHLPEGGSTLNVFGNGDFEITNLHLETLYTEGDIRMQYSSWIYTENYPGEINTGGRTTESVEFTESFYATANKKTCHLIEMTALQSGYCGLDGYIVDGNVLYKLHIAYKEKDADRALELLHLWADFF